MLLHRLDDYQSWRVVHRGTSLLIDPWLTPEPITGGFNRLHTDGFTTHADMKARSETVAAVLLCTSVNDHLRPETIGLFHSTPVHGPVKAAKIARNLGCSSTHANKPGDTFSYDCADGGRIVVTVTACGLPLAAIAHGYLIEGIEPDGTTAGRMWIEPHQPTVKVASRLAPIDAAVLPCQSVTAVVLPVTAGPKQSAASAIACSARAVVPTATNPRRDMAAWQKALYYVRGGVDRLQSRLAGRAQVVELRPHEMLDLGQATRSV